MDQELQGIGRKETKLKLRQKPSTESKARQSQTIDICGISAEAFQLNLRRKENTFFTTSLYEIDQLLQERKAEQLNDVTPGDQQPEETELQ
jgi:hypothetical protein